MTVRQAIAAPIYDFASAKKWIEGISDAGLMFHFEDAAQDIINAASGQPTFLADEVPIVRERVADLYSFEWGEFECPIGYALAYEARTETADPDTVAGELQAKIRAGEIADSDHLLPENPS